MSPRRSSSISAVISQMSLFFLIYRYMFGGAIHIAGMAYVDFLVPGLIATGVLFAGIGTATAMAEDLEQGFIDRLRSLPIPRSSVLAARALADTAIFAWSTVFTAGIAFAVGFRLHGSAIDGLAALALVIVFGFAFEWLFIAMGLFASNTQAAQGMGMIVFPFAFISVDADGDRLSPVRGDRPAEAHPVVMAVRSGHEREPVTGVPLLRAADHRGDSIDPVPAHQRIDVAGVGGDHL